MSSRLSIWSPKTLFYIVGYTIHKVEFEIGDEMRYMMGKLLEIV
jgi:hypothetical protein